MNQRVERTRSSMLWAAWADALGFISELTTVENLRRRTRGRELTHPMAWSRMVGGRMGVRVELPEGCYSDDTQLRLATSRAITHHGFDAEAFSRVELTVWPSYALGGGRASRAAAAAMAKQQANWANNFFEGWEKAGGNGAAMRIQPHVYAAPDLQSLDHLDDVIRNAIITHGHPRGIVGAVFHAVALTFAIDHGTVPDPSVFAQLLEATRHAIVAFSRQPELSTYWRPQWERKTEISFEYAWMETVDEIADVLRRARPAWQRLRAADGDRERATVAYDELVTLLGLHEEMSRGSGTLTSAAALLLASAFPAHPAQSAQIAASRLQTDTDTIGTMAAALVGAASPRPLMSPVLDADYLADEADRLHAVALGQPVDPFPYPDLLGWQPPKSAVDATGIAEGHLALAGLSYLDVFGEPTANRDGVWVWARTAFGQSVLVKHRREVRELPYSNWPSVPLRPAGIAAPAAVPTRRRDQETHIATVTQPPLFEDAELYEPVSTVDDLLRWLARTGYKDGDLGRALRIVASNGDAEDLRRFTDHIFSHLGRSKS